MATMNPDPEHASDPAVPVPDWLRPVAEALSEIDASDLSGFTPPADARPRAGAVLMAFAHSEDGLDLLLTERAHDMRSHPGQVSFPGGKVEPGESTEEAALREAWEEIGLDPRSVHVIGRLPELWLPPSNFAVTPVVAWWSPEAPDCDPISVRSPAEVHAIHRVAVADLIDPTWRRTVRGPSGWSSPGFLIGPDHDVVLWGFTGGIVSRLLDFIGWSVPWDDSVRVELPQHMLAGVERAGGRRVSTDAPAEPPPMMDIEEDGRVNWLDLLLLALACVFAFSGYWQGFITGAFATVGLLLGGAAGVVLVPLLLGDAERSVWTSLGAIFVVILCASLGQASFQYFGASVRDHVTWQPARVVDAIGGAGLSVVAVMVVFWALGVAVSGARISGIVEPVRASAVLGWVDEVMPEQADELLSSFSSVVGASEFPRYLEPFASEQIVDVAPGDSALPGSAGVQNAASSVLKIRGDNSCGRGVEGTGFLYTVDGAQDPNRLMTNAHVVAGVDEPRVQLGKDDWVDASVVYYDEDLDVAVLELNDGGLPALSFTDGEAEESVAILGYPQDGPYDVQAGRIRSEQQLRSPDIYGNGTVVREVFSLRGLVRPGNSGGPVVNQDGVVVGVIFAASVTDAETGYALTSDAVEQAAIDGINSDNEVDTGDCAT